MKGLIRKILKEELLTETSMPTSDKIIEIINNTISKGGSKTYKDLFNVKGEAAVGILHWTTRGLDKLYKEMDTERYFNKSEDDMIDFRKKVNGRELDYPWWEEGMEDFLKSKESVEVQNKAATKKFTGGTMKKAQAQGWSTDREIAVAMFYITSCRACLYNLGALPENQNEEGKWDAEKLLRAYCEGDCTMEMGNGRCDVSDCRSRCTHINSAYPGNPLYNC